MKALDLAAAAGITYRQLDYWARTGRITCWCGKPHGQGYPRHFTRREARVVIDAGALVAAGLKLDPALTIARAIATEGAARLGPYAVTTRARAGANGLCAACTQARREKTTDQEQETTA